MSEQIQVPDPKGLKEVIERGKRLVVFLHDNPDPDAIAAGWLLQDIAARLQVTTLMVHGGTMGRAENRAMVRLLDIPVERLDRRRVRGAAQDRHALVDTQPGAENNAFPDDLHPHVVIDHHPRRPDLVADFVDVRLDQGCTTTLLLAYHQAFGLELSADLATAAFYAIVSDTQDLDREASRADLSACRRLFPLVHLDLLGKLRHPPRERDYYRTIARAMRHVMIAKNTCVCHIGPVSSAEVVAEVADFLVAMKQITWCLVSGHHDGSLIASIRTTHDSGHADQHMHATLAGLGSGGGHDMIAGGTAPCADPGGYRKLADSITQRFLAQLPRRSPETLRPLLHDAEDGQGSTASGG